MMMILTAVACLLGLLIDGILSLISPALVKRIVSNRYTSKWFVSAAILLTDMVFKLVAVYAVLFLADVMHVTQYIIVAVILRTFVFDFKRVEKARAGLSSFRQTHGTEISVQEEIKLETAHLIGDMSGYAIGLYLLFQQ